MKIDLGMSSHVDFALIFRKVCQDSDRIKGIKKKEKEIYFSFMSAFFRSITTQ
ncbi:MAG: hypothetical protein Q8910_18100 [Bacteroidota bacterium]|nr:hypothetical protein [Bacteroidota bacterium]MDP4228270.1 hypothetical protein [Bacteroidota bacterium]